VTPTDTAVAREQSGFPLVGHLFSFRRDRLQLLNACIATPGDVIELRIRTPAYLLKRAEDIKHVLVAGDAGYAKDERNIGPRATRIFGNGLMTSSGDAHRPMRRRVQPVFRRESMAPLAEAAVRGVDAMVDRWEEAGEINLADEMARFALQAVMRSIFGVASGPEYEALEEGVIARGHSMVRGRGSLVPLPAFLPIAMRPQRRRAIGALDEVVDRLIAARRDWKTPGNDLLSMVMSAHEGGLAASDPRQVRHQAITLALAAHENIGRALTWSLLALARHPEVEARLREEVHRVLGERPPEAGDAENLRYTEMTVAESLRLWPPNALISRTARREDVLPTGTRIRPGAKILLSPYVIHRDPSYYPDPERFDPERFSEEETRGRPRYAYFPFGGGPRICIGQALAMLKLTLALARMAQRGVDLELAGEPPGYVCGCLPPGFGPSMRVRALAPRPTRQTASSQLGRDSARPVSARH
jgi:cytochrome P450